MTLEGSGASRLLQLFRRDGEPTTITLATVVNPSPISVRVDGDSIDTPSEGIIVAEHLTEHRRSITFKGEDTELVLKSALKKDDRVIVAIANNGQLIYVIDKAVI